MFEIIAVTDCRSCAEEPIMRIMRIARSAVTAIILREKGLAFPEYSLLAGQAAEACRESGTELIIHTFADAARQHGCQKLHLPFGIFKENPEQYRDFSVGVSIHSEEEAQIAAALGAARLVAGHIFETGCKQGLAPRGLGFLAAVCRSVAIPVYAIGGICACNIREVKEAGAAGACLMSPFMQAGDVSLLADSLAAASR
jgi:thiamine-phosphate pyrophosphorylase